MKWIKNTSSEKQKICSCEAMGIVNSDPPASCKMAIFRFSITRPQAQKVQKMTFFLIFVPPNLFYVFIKCFNTFSQNMVIFWEGHVSTYRFWATFFSSQRCILAHVCLFPTRQIVVVFPPKMIKIEVVTNKNILNVIMTQFGMIGLIVVAVAHCFEIFYKITKNNILPTNFKNFKKFQISKIKFSDILPKLFPYLFKCFCWLIWLLLQVFWYFLSKKLTIMGVK